MFPLTVVLYFLSCFFIFFSATDTPACSSGFDEFDFRVAGLLLFLNTFGTEILVAFTVPLAAAAATPQRTRAPTLLPPYSPDREPCDHGSGCSSAGLADTSIPTASVPTPRASNFGDGNRDPGARIRGRGVAAADFMSTAERSDRLGVIPALPIDGRSHGDTDGACYNYGARTREGEGAVLDTFRGEDGEGVGVTEGGGDRALLHASATSFLVVMERLSGLMLLLSAARTFLSAANVSVQRGHLMLWAVFAPKFVFDATMQAVRGAAAVVVWAVVCASVHGLSNSKRVVNSERSTSV